MKKNAIAHTEAAKICGFALRPNPINQDILQHAKHRPEIQVAHDLSLLNSSPAVNSKLTFWPSACDAKTANQG